LFVSDCFIAAAQAMQGLVHAVWQHTPSTQYGAVPPHWFAAVHASPDAFFGWQVLPAQ
jgi:hypothetical protein